MEAQLFWETVVPTNFSGERYPVQRDRHNHCTSNFLGRSVRPRRRGYASLNRSLTRIKQGLGKLTVDS